MSDSTVTIPGTIETATLSGQTVAAFTFALRDSVLGAVSLGTHHTELWATAGLGPKMIAADIALHIKEGRI